MKKILSLVRMALLSLAMFLSIPTLSAQVRVKVMHYNLLQYGNECGSVTLAQKNQWLSTILGYYQPDILTVNELAPNEAYSSNIKVKGFSYSKNIEYGEISNEAGSNIVNNIFFNTELFGYEGGEVLEGGLRDINVYTLYDKTSLEAGLDTIRLHLVIAHLKAGSNGSDVSQRAKEAGLIADWLASQPAEANILVMGDLNVQGSGEDAYQTLISPAGEHVLEDPTGVTTGWAGREHAALHTQSTRSFSSDCGVTGGMDDRFDFIFTSQPVMQGFAGVAYVPESYKTFGNDGNSYNQELGCSANESVPALICASLKQMSDHLPVVLELDLLGASPTANKPDLALKGVSLFPNPAQNELHITWQTKEPHLVGTLHVFDLRGQEVWRGTWQGRDAEKRLNLTGWHPGLYLLQVRGGAGGTLSRRFQVRP